MFETNIFSYFHNVLYLSLEKYNLENHTFFLLSTTALNSENPLVLPFDSETLLSVNDKAGERDFVWIPKQILTGKEDYFYQLKPPPHIYNTRSSVWIS